MSSNRSEIVKESQVELSVRESVNLWSIEVLTHLKKILFFPVKHLVVFSLNLAPRRTNISYMQQDTEILLI